MSRDRWSSHLIPPTGCRGWARRLARLQVEGWVRSGGNSDVLTPYRNTHSIFLSSNVTEMVRSHLTYLELLRSLFWSRAGGNRAPLWKLLGYPALSPMLLCYLTPGCSLKTSAQARPLLGLSGPPFLDPPTALPARPATSWLPIPHTGKQNSS